MSVPLFIADHIIEIAQREYCRQRTNKVGRPFMVNISTRTAIFEWSLVMCKYKNGHQKDYVLKICSPFKAQQPT